MYRPNGCLRTILPSIRNLSILIAGLLLLAAALGQPQGTVRADTGPKPEMGFAFEFKIDPVEVVSGQMLECEQSDCSDGTPLEELGPQHFNCTDSGCDSLAYGYATYHKLIIEFSDQTRESNVFKELGFYSSYIVFVSADALDVQPAGSGSAGAGSADASPASPTRQQPSASAVETLSPTVTPSAGAKFPVPTCTSGALLTLGLETLLASLYFSTFQLPRSGLGWVPLASLLTLPAVWYLFPLLHLPDWGITASSEVFAVSVEAAFLALVCRRWLSPVHAAALSILMNTLSFGVGWLLL